MNDDFIFDNQGYVLYKNLIDTNTIQVVSQYLENKIARGIWISSNDRQDPTAFSYYADPLIEVILKQYLPEIEEATGLDLEPTYSFSRVYQGHEELLPHTDRPSCEISVTVNVAKKGNNWPIFMQYKDNNPSKFELEAGDAVIYKGCEVTHWRKPLKKDNLNIQFMLHYVDKNGPHANYKFDRRKSLGVQPCL